MKNNISSLRSQQFASPFLRSEEKAVCPSDYELLIIQCSSRKWKLLCVMIDFAFGKWLEILVPFSFADHVSSPSILVLQKPLTIVAKFPGSSSSSNNICLL